MKIEHVFFLLCGVLFWGTIPVLSISFFLAKPITQLFEPVVMFVLFTFCATLGMQCEIGGFQIHRVLSIRLREMMSKL